MNCRITYETMVDDVGLILSRSIDISVDPDGDIRAQLVQKLAKLDAHAQMISYECDEENDDHLINCDAYFF